MPIFSSEVFHCNLKYNHQVKSEIETIVKEAQNQNPAFFANLMMGKNKFTVGDKEYNFEALKFNTNKQSTFHMGAFAIQLYEDLHEVSKFIEFDYQMVRNYIVKVGGTYEDLYGLDRNKIDSKRLTEKELNEEILGKYPTSKEDEKAIKEEVVSAKIKEVSTRIQEKTKKRNSVSTENMTSLDELKEAMDVKYANDLDSMNKAQYIRYSYLRQEAREEALPFVEKYQNERKAIFDKTVEEKQNGLQSSVETFNQKLKDAWQSGKLKDVFAEYGMENYEKYLSDKIAEICDRENPNKGKQSEVLEQVNKQTRKLLFEAALKNGNDIEVEGVNLKAEIEKDLPKFMSDFKDKETLKTQKEIEEYKTGFSAETEKGTKEIYDKFEFAKATDRNYENGLRIAEKMGLDNRFVGKALDVIKNAQTKYNSMSTVGRFFSYLNPFPNKYREARNNISEMITELSENTGIGKDKISDFVYGELTEKPKLDAPSYEEVSANHLKVQSYVLRHGSQEAEESIVNEANKDEVDKNFQKNIDSQEKLIDEEFSKKLAGDVVGNPQSNQSFKGSKEVFDIVEEKDLQP